MTLGYIAVISDFQAHQLGLRRSGRTGFLPCRRGALSAARSRPVCRNTRDDLKDSRLRAFPIELRGNGKRLQRSFVVSGTTTCGISTTKNRVTNTTGTLVRTCAYDGRGNITGTGSAAFTYEVANRMSSATVGWRTTAYAVNALGQRVRKSSTQG